MTNPIAYALTANPQQFLKGLDTKELSSVMQGCVDILAQKAEAGDHDAALALLAAGRVIGAVEI